MRLRRGELVYLRPYCDTQTVAEVCERLARRGMAEAAAPPIEEWGSGPREETTT